MASGVLPTSRCMSMSTSNSRASSKMRSDLAGLVGVVARRGADHLGAALQALDQQLVGAGIVGQAFLRKDADLDVDRPSVVGDQRLHALEAAHADAGIDLDLRAHARRAVHDALLQRVLGRARARPRPSCSASAA